MKEKLANLMTVKSIVTIIMTVVFAYLSITDRINDAFMLVYTVVIGFYFGTQHEKKTTEAGEGK